MRRNFAPLYSAGIDGTGQKIAIAGQSQIQLSDVQHFRSEFGLAAKDPVVTLLRARAIRASVRATSMRRTWISNGRVRRPPTPPSSTCMRMTF